jgi:hypothetical protein
MPVTATSLRSAMTTLLTCSPEQGTVMELPSAIQPLNLHDREALRFEALAVCDPRRGFMGTCAYQLTFQCRQFRIQIQVRGLVRGSPVLSFSDSSGSEYRVGNFKEDSIKDLPSAVRISCIPGHASFAVSAVLNWQLRREDFFFHPIMLTLSR